VKNKHQFEYGSYWENSVGFCRIEE